MDNPTPLPSSPPILPSISLKPKPKIPKILFILIPLLVVIILIGIIFITKPFNLFQPKKIITTSTKNTSANIPIKVQDSSPSSVGLRIDPKYNTIGFHGKVKEKGKTFLVLTGADKTIKVEISNQIKIRLINQAEFAKNPDLYWTTAPKFIQLSEIKIGDAIDTLGYGDETLLNAFEIMVIK